ncbi:MAG: cytochrome b N-terminal domain-containing protein [Propionibacteriaceae bacterium]
MQTSWDHRLLEQLRRLARQERVDRLLASLRGRVVPSHWSFVFGVISVACLFVLTVTGVFLMFYYSPSSATVTYQGRYPLLHGVEMSEAFASTMRISFDVRGGLLMRQAHHWAALLLPAALLMQLLSIFFTGAFRRPRRLGWVLLFGVFGLTLVGGWSGYGLPDDMLSGTGLRIVEGVVLGIPVVGTWVSLLLFGGGYPGEILAHLYPLHVLVVPVLIVALVALRALVAYGQKPPQFAGPGRTQHQVVGVPLLPTAATKQVGLFFVTVGVILVMASTLTITPIWLYGPSDPAAAGAGSQPDWYTAFLDGALRLVPPGWEFVWLGRTWTPAVFLPVAVVTVFLALVALYPFIEGWITGDTDEHHLLDRPRDAATRTGVGVAGMVFYGTLWLSGSADLLATTFQLSFEGVIHVLQVVLILGPVVALVVTRQVCFTLQSRDHDLVLHGAESGVIRRLASGRYVEVHRPLEAAARSRLRELEPVTADPEKQKPVLTTTATSGGALRVRLARWYASARSAPERDS